MRNRRRAPPESKPEDGTTSFGIVDRHAASHGGDQRLHKGQPDTAARTLNTVAATTETLKHQLPFRLGDAGAVVANLQDNPLRLAEVTKLDRRRGRTVLASVVDQMDQTLQHSIPISEDLDRLGIHAFRGDHHLSLIHI